MEMPIQYALTYPERLDLGQAQFDFSQAIEFYPPDEETFPMPTYCKKALEIGGTMPAMINSANECAVKLFLEEKIGFLDIMKIVEHTLITERADEYNSVEQIKQIHDEIYNKIANNYRSITEN
ncbi:MAG: 1-deoxy-D-xylulose-5-phosphate reductoisomerase, partial [Clostridia bacterium]|nr:1-deoxy-D-xylulose-5-phosphate reductoisomerase [Clostridia bacterium]